MEIGGKKKKRQRKCVTRFNSVKKVRAQQVNEPKHTSQLCKKYLKTKEEHKVTTVMEFPPQSPDLNPSELYIGPLQD